MALQTGSIIAGSIGLGGITQGSVERSGNPFISIWDTTNISGSSSASNQIALPLVSGGIYDFIVNWGDGNADTITAYNQAERLHTYAVAGIYKVTISGIIDGFRFGGALDRLKLLDISKWGILKVGNGGSYFWGCINLVGTASDVLDLSGTTTLYQMFRLCPLFEANNLGLWDVSNVINAQLMFDGVTLPTANYDSLLIGWDSLPSLQNNVTFSGGGSQYSAGAAATARANIVSTFNWTITDGGLAP